MRLERRFSVMPSPFEPEVRWVERAGEIVECSAPPDWTTTRVEAWLDWADRLPTDAPQATAGTSATTSPGAGLLADGPDCYARRLAAWGLALGDFDDAAGSASDGDAPPRRCCVSLYNASFNGPCTSCRV